MIEVTDLKRWASLSGMCVIAAFGLARCGTAHHAATRTSASVPVATTTRSTSTIGLSQGFKFSFKGVVYSNPEIGFAAETGTLYAQFRHYIYEPYERLLAGTFSQLRASATIAALFVRSDLMAVTANARKVTRLRPLLPALTQLRATLKPLESMLKARNFSTITSINRAMRSLIERASSLGVPIRGSSGVISGLSAG